MAPFVGISAAVLLAGLIIYNATVSYRWHQDHRGNELLSESTYWHGSFFYSNSDDPRLIVAKRTGGVIQIISVSRLPFC